MDRPWEGWSPALCRSSWIFSEQQVAEVTDFNLVAILDGAVGRAERSSLL